MSKSIYEEAVETLNKYRNQNYNSTNKDEVELANAINVILPNYVKQQKMLELYKGYYEINETNNIIEFLKRTGEFELVKTKIKELENE